MFQNQVKKKKARERKTERGSGIKQKKKKKQRKKRGGWRQEWVYGCDGEKTRGKKNVWIKEMKKQEKKKRKIYMDKRNEK